MRKLFSYLFIIFGAMLFYMPNIASTQDIRPNIQVKEEFKPYFQEADVQGAFVLYDLKNNSYIYYNEAGCDTAFIPASTFKIMSFLVALETGVVKDEKDTLQWDGVDRGLSVWNQNTDLKSAMKNSVVWYNQRVIAQIGQERMQYYIDKAHYGNQNIGGGLDKFWLKGDLRISPNQQIDFLVRLYNNKLPFTERNMKIIKDIMITSQASDKTVHAKTGWSTFQGQEVGWYVGYIEKNNNVYFFATNLTSAIGNPNFVAARVAITNKILADLGVL